MAQGQSEAVVLTGFALRSPLPRAYVTNLCCLPFRAFHNKVNVGPRQEAQEGTGKERRKSSEWKEQIVEGTGTGISKEKQWQRE